jgi:hypothetical protein
MFRRRAFGPLGFGLRRPRLLLPLVLLVALIFGWLMLKLTVGALALGAVLVLALAVIAMLRR